MPLLEKASNQGKPDARLANALGTLYKELGRFDKARQCFDRAIALKPLSGKAYWNRSDLVDNHEDEIVLLEQMVRRLPEDSPQLPYFCFSLYRVLEKVKDTEKAFHYLSKGNRVKKALLDYSVISDLEADRHLISFFNHQYQFLQDTIENASAPALTPIFIVGMPRSGSSLVEQVLASHSTVTGAGELSLLSRVTGQTLSRSGITKPFPDALLSHPEKIIAKIGEAYLHQAQPLAKGKAVLTDKFLLNYKAVPLISLALPTAKIIHVRRNAMDTCFGCYRQLFNSGLGFCYDLNDLAATWHSYSRMMSSWNQLLGEQIYTLQYENLIDNTEGEISRLLAFCGLEEEAACHNFYDNSRIVKTASNLQVRQPVFTSSLGRWKPYEKHLHILCDALLRS